MKLESVTLKNFRGYVEQTIAIEDLTVLVGRNDVGKSTVLEALAIFFDAKGAKADASDVNKGAPTKTFEVRCTFVEFPESLVIDATARTTLEKEYLLNDKGRLEIGKRWTFAGKTKAETFAYALHPSNPGIDDLLELKIEELRKRVAAKKLTPVDARTSASFRQALLAAVPEKAFAPREIPLDDGDGKKIWEQLEREMPLYFLFKADRATSDEDGEAQDPMTLAVQQALKALEAEREHIRKQVRKSVEAVAVLTLAELRKIDPNLAEELRPTFKAEPKWESLFKLSLTADNDIPMNKRGSGVRRMVLLSFLLAEVERRRQESGRDSVIFAIEEPETSLHPTQQRLLVETLDRISNTGSTQVLITTHAPALAALLPHRAIRLVRRDDAAVGTCVEVGEGAVERVARELGILPHPDRQTVRVVVCVEGSTDVAFFAKASQVLRQVETTLPDLSGDDPRVLVLPLGGGTLCHWVENRYLRGLGVPEVHVYDRDDRDPPKYQGDVDKVNDRGDGSKAFLTKRRELENYYHPSAIETVEGVRVTFTSACDVAALVAAPVYELKQAPKKWADAAPHLRKNCADRVKARLATAILDHISAEHLKETGFLDELREWMAPVTTALQAAR